MPRRLPPTWRNASPTGRRRCELRSRARGKVEGGKEGREASFPPSTFPLALFFREQVDGESGGDDDERADDVEPEVGDIREEEAVEHDQLADDRADEGRRAAHAFKVEGEQEDAEDRAVEERA